MCDFDITVFTYFFCVRKTYSHKNSSDLQINGIGVEAELIVGKLVQALLDVVQVFAVDLQKSLVLFYFGIFGQLFFYELNKN